MLRKTRFNISQAAIPYKKSRNTLYQAIQKGILSKDHDALVPISLINHQKIGIILQNHLLYNLFLVLDYLGGG